MTTFGQCWPSVMVRDRKRVVRQERTISFANSAYPPFTRRYYNFTIKFRAYAGCLINGSSGNEPTNSLRFCGRDNALRRDFARLQFSFRQSNRRFPLRSSPSSFPSFLFVPLFSALSNRLPSSSLFVWSLYFIDFNRNASSFALPGC